MAKSFFFLCLFMATAACSGPSKSQQPVVEKIASTPQWSYEEQGIVLHLNADSQLNLYDGSPHTLLMCIYQLADPAGFDRLRGDDQGLYQLLECVAFDSSVRASKKTIIQPGEDTTVSLDRVEGAQYVAVCAGYYTMEKDGMIRQYRIPIEVTKAGTLGRETVATVGRLNVDLAFGQTAIATPPQPVETQYGQQTHDDQEQTPERTHKDGDGGRSVKEHIKSAKETVETVEEAGETVQKAKGVTKGVLK